MYIWLYFKDKFGNANKGSASKTLCKGNEKRSLPIEN
jgi:hypothetical protein